MIDCQECDSKHPEYWLMLTIKRTYKDTPHLQRVYKVTAKQQGDRWVFDGLGAPLKAVFDICNSYAIDRLEAAKSIHKWADLTEHQLNARNLT